MVGPRGGRGGTIEGRISEHCGGKGGIGISKFGVGDGKREISRLERDARKREICRLERRLDRRMCDET